MSSTTELAITNTIENIKNHWFHTKDQFNHKDGIDVYRFRTWRSKFELEKCLKRLYFKGTYSDLELLNLNDFTQIEQLTLDMDFVRCDVNRLIDINLPNLKILHDDCSNNYRLRLNTPKLEILKCQSLRSIDILYPDNIKKLEMDFYILAADSLKNVQYLKVDGGFLRRKNILSVHPKLTTLVCDDQFEEEVDDEDHTEKRIASLNALRQLINQRPELTIYFENVKLDKIEKINEYESQKSLAFQINNYGSLCDDIYFDGIVFDYNELMALVNYTLPDDFYKKYFNIQSVAVFANVKSEKHFVEFIKRLEYLNSLWLRNVSFDRSFYDRLPEMDQLTFLNVENSSKPITNYDFLFKMYRLETIQTNQDSAEFFDLTLALFTGLKYFHSITFHVDDEVFCIYKDTSRNEYTINRKKENTEKKKTETILTKHGMHFDELARLLIGY